MPSITKEQFNKWNSKATNGFSFDVKQYVVWGEKTLIKHVDLTNGKIAEFRVWYKDEYETKTNKWGCKWNEKTGNKIPCLVINVLIPRSTEGVYTVHTYGDSITLGDAEKKCNYNVLCKLADKIDVNKYLAEMMDL